MWDVDDKKKGMCLNGMYFYVEPLIDCKVEKSFYRLPIIKVAYFGADLEERTQEVRKASLSNSHVKVVGHYTPYKYMEGKYIGKLTASKIEFNQFV
jgi:hypothetical protein